MTLSRKNLRNIVNKEMKKIIFEQGVTIDPIVMDPIEIKGSLPPMGLEGSEEVALFLDLVGALTDSSYDKGAAEASWYQVAGDVILTFLQGSQDANSLSTRHNNIIRVVSHYLKDGSYPIDETLLIGLVDDALEVARSTLGSRVETRMKESRAYRNMLHKIHRNIV